MRRWLRASILKITRATHTKEKPIHRSRGMGSPIMATPKVNCMTGARYCMSPMTESGKRLAAAPKKSSGIDVTAPASSNNAV